eukprot:15461229-Alexandrium_andersonii.AAC.1
MHILGKRVRLPEEPCWADVKIRLDKKDEDTLHTYAQNVAEMFHLARMPARGRKQCIAYVLNGLAAVRSP